MRWAAVAMTLGRTISASSLRRMKLISGACHMYERSEKNKPEHDSLPKYGSEQCENARKARKTDKTYVDGSYAPSPHFISQDTSPEINHHLGPTNSDFFINKIRFPLLFTRFFFDRTF